MNELSWVSVPVLGIIFLSIIENTNIESVLHLGFRPRTGDYFFIKTLNISHLVKLLVTVSVPVLGIIFLSLPSIVMITKVFNLQSSVESL